MPQDAFTLKYLSAELNNLFAGGKINKIVQPDNDEVIFTIYNGKTTYKLSLCVNPSCPRIGVVDEEKECPLTAPNFCMLLRKHLLNGTIESISLIGYDRIVKITIKPYAEYYDSLTKDLYVELMGRYSNVILTEDNKILGANRGINVFDNGVRPLFVGKSYQFPPVGNKMEPNDKRLVNYFSSCDIKDLPRSICEAVQGVALSTATELVSQYYDKYNDYNCQKFYDFLNQFLYSSKPSPCVRKVDGELVDVSVFPYNSSGEIISFDYLYQAENYYFSQKEIVKKFNLSKERYVNLTNTALKKAKKKLNALISREKDAESCEDNKIKGELILANIYRIKQGDKSCTVYDYYNEKDVCITLNENLSPSKNAESYFKKYAKQKRTIEAIIPQKSKILEDVEYFENILDELKFAEDTNELNIIKNELIDLGILRENTKTKKRDEMVKFREYLIDGCKVLVGRNNIENDRLTFTSASDDLWLHVKDYQSSHVIIRSGKNQLKEQTIMKAASICAYYSKCRNEIKVQVDYTQKKHVKKPAKSKPGKVVYDNFKTIVVKPNKLSEFLKNN
ncbi:MAG: NFACT family protein [Clostridia bacterium]|nr:NFACT family protein [Clostridia bacterium]